MPTSDRPGVRNIVKISLQRYPIRVPMYIRIIFLRIYCYNRG